jgi:hypothetical protein
MIPSGSKARLRTRSIFGPLGSRDQRSASQPVRSSLIGDAIEVARGRP